MRFFQTPTILQKIFKSILWRLPQESNTVYLTFDDGPIPMVTPWVVEILDSYKAKATFFCVGDNLKKNPEIANLLKRKGHKLGNHTFRHLNGWKTPNSEYYTDIKCCGEYLDTTLFRPPYGKLSLSQFNHLKNTYQLVFWDIISYDFDPSFSPNSCLRHLIKKTRSGSIIVFHDSLKAFENLKWVLPRYLQFCSENGFQFRLVPEREI